MYSVLEREVSSHLTLNTLPIYIFLATQGDENLNKAIIIPAFFSGVITFIT